LEYTLKNTARITIRGNWDIGVIENHIKEYLCDCEIWGDLNISSDEYSNIKTKIAEALGSNPTGKNVKALVRRYPLLMVTDFVCFVLYEYDNNEFWNGWANRYKINMGINNQSEVGRMIREIIKKFNSEVIEDGGFVYVTPIICQAGIPLPCFDKLFDILDSTLNSSYFIAREIVSELMGYRNYLIDVPVERYFRLHTERAIELIVQMREMMHTVGDLSLELTDVPELPYVQQRIVKRYAQWSTEIKKIGRKNRKGTQYYFSPKLVYDDTKGICLFIPEQTLRQNSIYELRWTIIGDSDIENAKIFYSQVYNSNGRNYTREVNVPVDIAKTYTIQLRDNDDDSVLLTNPWVLNGLDSENDILTFNENGFLMPQIQRYISRKGTVVVLDSRTAKIIEIHSINKIDIDLPKSRAGLQAFYAYTAEEDARLIIQTLSEIIYIERKHSFDIELVQIGTLFNEKYNSKETPVYTCFPTVEVSGDIENYNQTLFNNWQVLIIHRLSNTKHTMTLSELDFGIYNNRMLFSLNNYVQEFYLGMYGEYELRVYDGKTRKYFTFYLSPKIEHIAHIEDIKSDRSFRNSRAVFYVQKNDTATLEFENGSGINVLPAYKKGLDWLEISITNRQACIRGNVIFEYRDNIRKFPFKKTIRKFEWSFWNEKENDLSETGKVKQFYMEDLIESTWRLALHFTDAEERYDVVKLVLETANSKKLQSKEIILDRFGNASVTINLFLDTIRENLLPQRLMLYVSKGYDDYLPICLAIFRSFVQLKNPKYSIVKDRPIVYWEQNCENELFNKRLELISLNDFGTDPIEYSLTDNVRNFKGKGGKTFEGIFLDKPLNDGIYYIDTKEDMDFSLFDNEEQAIPSYDNAHILYVNGKKVLERIFADKNDNLFDWLSAATIAIHRIEWITIVLNKLRVQIKQSKMLFNIKKCAPLLFSLLINSGEKSNLAYEVKIKIKEVCAIINDFMITNTDRLEILKYLLESNISDNNCKNIINELHLYLFCPNDSVMFNKLSVQRMWNINQEMAILMNVRNCVSNITIDIDRVLSRIGCESLEDIIKITPNVNCASNDWTNCIEQIFSGKCKCDYVCFECSKKVWGDGNEYLKLFVSDKRGNWIRQIPDRSHTDGYEIFGKNYLTLIFELTPENQDFVIKEYIDSANQEIYKVEKLTLKYIPFFQNLHSVIRNRLTGNAEKQKLFYQIGCSSALIALSSRKVIDSADLQELLPFWKNVMGAYPALVYRDLILAELHMLFGNGKGN
jgi:hypothetical protein